MPATSLMTIRRYTNALTLIDVIRNERLTLVPPTRWFDQNDALGLEAYSKLRGDGSVYAMCFALGAEQAHHWQIFASGNNGVCLVLDYDAFVDHLENLNSPDLLFRAVEYCNLSQIRSMYPIRHDLLPFLKRDTFKAEAEYRVVAWEESFFATSTYSLPLPPHILRRVVFGPNVPESFAKTLQEIAIEKKKWSHVTFAKSRLVNNESWASAIEIGVGKND